jgi:hypothetical protein
MLCVFRNTTTRTYPRTSSATSGPCQMDSCRISRADTLASSSTCTRSSPTLPSAESPCFAHTLISPIDHKSLTPHTTYILLMFLHTKPKNLCFICTTNLGPCPLISLCFYPSGVTQNCVWAVLELAEVEKRKVRSKAKRAKTFSS